DDVHDHPVLVGAGGVGEIGGRVAGRQRARDVEEIDVDGVQVGERGRHVVDGAVHDVALRVDAVADLEAAVDRHRIGGGAGAARLPLEGVPGEIARRGIAD